MQNALPVDADVIPIKTIAANVNRTSQTVRRALEKAGVKILYPTARQPSVLRADYVRHLAGSNV